jgi:hypothetical protein
MPADHCRAVAARLRGRAHPSAARGGPSSAASPPGAADDPPRYAGAARQPLCLSGREAAPAAVPAMEVGIVVRRGCRRSDLLHGAMCIVSNCGTSRGCRAIRARSWRWCASYRHYLCRALEGGLGCVGIPAPALGSARIGEPEDGVSARCGPFHRQDGHFARSPKIVPVSGSTGAGTLTIRTFVLSSAGAQ